MENTKRASTISMLSTCIDSSLCLCCLPALKLHVVSRVVSVLLSLCLSSNMDSHFLRDISNVDSTGYPLCPLHIRLTSFPVLLCSFSFYDLSHHQQQHPTFTIHAGDPNLDFEPWCRLLYL